MNEVIVAQPHYSTMSIVESIDNNVVIQTMKKIAEYQRLVQATLVEGKDFGKIPGCGDKPTLLKPGAEKINMLMGTCPKYEIINKEEDFKNGFFNYNFKCTIYRDGHPVSEGVGNCNSMEVKYKYITVEGYQLSDHGYAPETAKEMTDRYGRKKYRVPNPEPADKANTILKMAKKRAFVDATLQLASLSDLFTQDIEDIKDSIDIETEAHMTANEAANIKIGFGKYKGKTCGELYGENKGWFVWLSQQDKPDKVLMQAYELLKSADTAQPKQMQAQSQSRPLASIDQAGHVEELPF